MKILIIGNRNRYEKFRPNEPVMDASELIFCDRGTPDSELLEKGRDADILLADAISPVSAALIEGMPNLKMIHSEGVAFNLIDCKAAARRGIFVCNNKGANASAVAEQTVFLMLAVLRDGVRGHAAVREGKQIQMKEAKMASGITDLRDCTVGLIGFGDIASETAKLLRAFGCRILYTSLHKKSREVELRYDMEYRSMTDLLGDCDIISLHCAVTSETTGMVNADFLEQMKDGAILINTARGDLVDNVAVRNALVSGKLSGAGFDTIAPEPTMADNPLVDLPEGIESTVVYAPHLGGITSGSFRRMYKNLWHSVALVAEGKRPANIVNGL